MTMSHFCTLFDRAYLTRGLALYTSLQHHAGPFRLWALCLDEPTYHMLRRLALPHLVPIALADFERGDDALLAAKQNRSKTEYYFTCTPALIQYLLQRHPQIDELTYIDADMALFSSPQPAFDALGDGLIGIVAHRFPQRLQRLERLGRFNVGWLIFRRSPSALACIAWWREQCIEWCYDRYEPGRFADQKYLDAWPATFNGVRVIDHPGVNLAPWNLGRHRVSIRDGCVYADDRPLIVYHYHGLRQRSPTLYDTQLQHYGIWRPAKVLAAIYRPYIALLEALAALSVRAPDARALSALARISQPLHRATAAVQGEIDGRFIQVRDGQISYSRRPWFYTPLAAY